MKRGHIICVVIAGPLIALLTIIRADSELAMMTAQGSDPQMPIWIMELVVKLAFWVVIGVPSLLVPIAMRNSWAPMASAAWLTIWCMSISWASWQYREGAQALIDAADTSASPQRLAQLVHFDGIKAGYELDNRIASNPRTPVEALRLLHKRNQSGTDMCLARNPNTPEDILEKLAEENDELIQRGLSQNPRLSD